MAGARSRLLVLLSALLVIVLLPACDTTPDQYTPEPNVFCLLRSDQTRTIAMAGMTVAYSDSIGADWNGVSGVEVSVRHSGTEFRFGELPDSAGFYFTDSLPMVPGDSYFLTMEYPDGSLVSSSTLMQPRCHIDSVYVDTVTHEYEHPYDTCLNITFTWAGNQAATHYLFSIIASYAGPNGSGAGWGYELRDADSCRVSLSDIPLSQLLYGYQEPDTVWLTSVSLELWSVDQNYLDYYRRSWWGPGGSEEPARLEGGLGVFGSASIAETTLLFRGP